MEFRFNECHKAFILLLGYLHSNKTVQSLDDLRYVLFVKKSLNNEKLTRTSNAFEQPTLRANYQSYIWIHASIIYLPSPGGHGWKIYSVS